jgi:hypothetical protein
LVERVILYSLEVYQFFCSFLRLDTDIWCKCRSVTESVKIYRDYSSAKKLDKETKNNC